MVSSQRGGLTHLVQLAVSQQKRSDCERSCQRAKGTSMMCQHTALKQKAPPLSRLPHHFHQLLTECGQRMSTLDSSSNEPHLLNSISTLPANWEMRVRNDAKIWPERNILERRQEERQYTSQSDWQQQSESMWTLSSSSTDQRPAASLQQSQLAVV